jgi:D-inositol-3-phosphate glycosyltransferase
MNPLTVHPADTPLRIAMLSIHSSPLGPLGTQNTGGMSVYVRELSRHLGSFGHCVDIFTCVPGPSHPIPLGPNVRLIHLTGTADGEISKEHLPDHLTRIYHLLDRQRRAFGIDYDLIHSHYWISGVVGAMAQAQWRCPHLTMFHTLGIVKNISTRKENESDRRIAHERWLAKVADHIVVPAQRESDHLVHYYHARPENISVIPCGVDLNLFQPFDRASARSQLSLAANAELLLYVGRFAPLKGLDGLVDALRDLKPRYPHLRMMVVGGDGPQATSTRTLEQLVYRNGLSSCVDFAGRVDQDCLPPYYSAADVLVLPSHYESFGLVVLEALACGTPVAAAPVGAVESIVRTGFNGTLFRSAAAHHVAQGLQRMLDRPKERRPAAERIRTTVLTYGWDHIAVAVANTYADLLRQHDPGQSTEVYLAGAIYPN